MSVGSKWYKFDFHNHTPASNDYKKPETSDREWLLAYMKHQVDAVIISDHNSGARIDSLKNELQQMAQEAEMGELPDYHPLTLFPGVELTATSNVHILAVFPPDSSGADAERLIGQCNNDSPFSPRARNNELVLQLGPAGIINVIRRNPGILCILAHIDAPKGVLHSLTNQGELEDAFSARPHAVEIRHNIEDITDGTHKRLIQNLPCVRGSDAHHPDHAGTRTCWLKMSYPNFDGLRHALLDHENCVLFNSLPPKEPALQIRSLKLKTRLCATQENEPTTIKFSPFYNAIIGSRGSGKSTIIESIRLAMRKTEGLSASKVSTLESFRKVGQGMREDSILECIFRKDGSDFRLAWSPGEKHTLHTWVNGEWSEDTNWSAERFPISIYSQKMLFELASDNEAFLRVCDESPNVNKREWVAQWDELERAFKNEKIALRGHLARRENASSLAGELADAQRSVSQLSESAYYPVRHRLTLAERELSAAESSLEQYAERIWSLEALVPEAQHSDVPAEPSSGLSEFMACVSTAQQSFDLDVKQLLTRGERKLDELKDNVHLSALVASVSREKENVRREAELLREQGLNPDTLDELMARCERLKNDLKKFDGLAEAITASEGRISQLQEKMRAHRMELTAKRREFLASLQLQGLDIKILPLCATPDSTVSGYQSTTGITNFTDRIYDGEGRNGLLYTFISNIPFNPAPTATDTKYALLDTVKFLHQSIKQGNNEAGCELHGMLKNRLKNLPDEILDSLMCWYPDDGIHIRYCSPGGTMEDITSASPGQKGASMLQFLLSYGTDPLLLDQPEDDLDCLMLSQSVIPAITANKKRRQLIIVSHSAPIVVNGDAEYVISMKHDRTGLRPGLCDALQQKEMKMLICRQMEGGEKAFRSRYERILS